MNMKNRHIRIEKFDTDIAETTYYVYDFDFNVNKKKIVYQGTSKSGVYLVAHKYARVNNLPLYEIVYKGSVDDNGILHHIPVERHEITL
jgi:hypothetical protein